MLLEARSLTKTFGAFKAVNDVSLRINKGADVNATLALLQPLLVSRNSVRNPLDATTIDQILAADDWTDLDPDRDP